MRRSLLDLKEKVKKVLPYWVRRPLRLAFEFGLRIGQRFRLPPKYEEKVAAEVEEGLSEFQNHKDDEPLNESAPPSWDFVETATQELIRKTIGFSQWEYVVDQVNLLPAPELLSLGSGPCGIEISLAERFQTSYHYHCMDLNKRLLDMGKKQADQKGLNLTVQEMDLNRIVLEAEKYDIITAFASLHHLIELESVLCCRKSGSEAGGTVHSSGRDHAERPANVAGDVRRGQDNLDAAAGQV